MKKAFTLIELLVVIAIIAILAAILFPVFARARENARRSSCQSNMKQLGLGFIQYSQDFDEKMPIHYYNSPDLNGPWDWPRSSGQGWGAKIYPYVKNRGVYTCPSDSTKSGNGAFSVISYGYNHSIPFSSNGSKPNNHVAKFNQSARTVLGFELKKDVADVSNPSDLNTFSGDGYIKMYNDLYFSGQVCWQCQAPDQGYISYETGLPKGRTNADYAIGSPGNDYMVDNKGRHLDGANYVFADGHVKWYKGSAISAGEAAGSPTAAQSGSIAEGTDYGGSDKAAATYSPI